MNYDEYLNLIYKQYPKESITKVIDLPNHIAFDIKNDDCLKTGIFIPAIEKDTKKYVMYNVLENPMKFISAKKYEVKPL